jgi:hypothetical protein
MDVTPRYSVTNTPASTNVRIDQSHAVFHADSDPRTKKPPAEAVHASPYTGTAAPLVGGAASEQSVNTTRAMSAGSTHES